MGREVCTFKRLAQIKAGFQNSKCGLGVVEREPPAGAEEFLRDLLKDTPDGFEVEGEVRGAFATEDIMALLDPFAEDIALETSEAFESWLLDMTQVVKCFCRILGTDSVSFWLGSARGCKNYHVDAVPLRMLVTYAGAGTEWVPDDAVDRKALEKHEHARIVTDTKAIRSVRPWDVALFRGDEVGYDGVVHRTPPEALEGYNSILLRLDHPSLLRMRLGSDEEMSEDEGMSEGGELSVSGDDTD